MSEIEENGLLSFLDITISYESNKFVTLVYRRPTFCGVFTNFGSYIPDMHKHELIETLHDLPYCKLKVIFRSKCSFNTFNLKIHLRKKICSGIICYTYSNCKVTYYGKTTVCRRVPAPPFLKHPPIDPECVPFLKSLFPPPPPPF